MKEEYEISLERLDTLIQGKCTVTPYGSIMQANRNSPLSLREKYFLVSRYLNYDTNQNENWNFLKQNNKIRNRL